MTWAKRSMFLLLSFILSNSTVFGAGVESIANGLDLQTTPAGSKSLTYLRISLNMFDVRVTTPLVSSGDFPSSSNNVSGSPERMARGFFLKEYLHRFQGIAVISGGYIDSYSPPTSLGFVKSNNVVTSPVHVSWLVEALFCSDIGRASVELIGSTVDRPKFRDCLQSGPLLLLNGRPPSDVPSVRAPSYAKFSHMLLERTFACTDASGRVLLGVTEKIDLSTLVETLRRPELGCVNAIGLTGSDTSGLLVNKKLFGNDSYLFPNAIVVVPRKR